VKPQVNAVYRHYKGGIYLVVGHALHTETEEDLVLYVRLGTQRVFARPREMFTSTVIFGGMTYQRFRLDEAMLSRAGEDAYEEAR